MTCVLPVPAEERVVRALHPGRWSGRGVFTVRSRCAPFSMEPPRPRLPLTMRAKAAAPAAHTHGSGVPDRWSPAAPERS